MISGTLDSDLANRGIRTQAQQAFVQRWLEALHHSTMDSYGAKLLSTHTSLRELLSVIDLILESYHFPLDEGHVVGTWDEARERVNGDDVLRTAAPALWQALRDTLKALNLKRLRRSRQQLGPLVKILDQQYHEWVISSLSEALAKNDIPKAIRLADTMCSELLATRDPDSLFFLGRHLIDGPANVEDRWTHFLAVIRRPDQPMTVFIKLTAPAAQALRAHQEKLEIAVQTKDEIMKRPAFSNSPNMVSLENAVIAVRAHDVRTAALRAWDTVNRALYLVGSAAILGTMMSSRSKMAVEYVGSRGVKAVVVSLELPSRWWDESRQVTDVLLEVLALPGLPPQDADRLRRASEYLYLASVGSSPATAFVHNWFALEAMVRTSGTVFEDVRDYVPPLLCSRYIGELLECFLRDCAVCGVDLAGLVNSSKPGERKTETLRLLATPRLRGELAARCQGHQLLGHRLSELSAALATGNSTRELLKSHRIRLERHLQRMYRMRNSIVHGGGRAEPLVPCLKHLNTYVHRVLLEVGERLLSGTQCLADVLVLAHHNHRVTLEALKGRDEYDPQIALGGALQN